MRMYDPPHPGEIVREDCLKALGLSVTEGAKILHVSRKTLSELVNGKAGLSPEMAVRLSKAFGSSAKAWLGMQLDYDLWQVEQRADEIEVERYEVV